MTSRTRSTEINRRLKAGHADHPYIPLLMSVPGIGWVLAFTIAAEIGEIERFASPQKLTGYTGPLPARHPVGRVGSPRAVDQARPHLPALGTARGDDARLRHPAYSARYQRTSAGSASAGRRSPRSTSPAGLPTRSGTCSPKPGVRSPRRRFSSGGLTALLDMRPRAKHPISPDPPAEEAIET